MVWISSIFLAKQASTSGLLGEVFARLVHEGQPLPPGSKAWVARVNCHRTYQPIKPLVQPGYGHHSYRDNGNHGWSCQANRPQDLWVSGFQNWWRTLSEHIFHEQTQWFVIIFPSADVLEMEADCKLMQWIVCKNYSQACQPMVWISCDLFHYGFQVQLARDPCRLVSLFVISFFKDVSFFFARYKFCSCAIEKLLSCFVLSCLVLGCQHSLRIWTVSWWFGNTTRLRSHCFCKLARDVLSMAFVQLFQGFFEKPTLDIKFDIGYPFEWILLYVKLSPFKLSFSFVLHPNSCWFWFWPPKSRVLCESMWINVNFNRS